MSSIGTEFKINVHVEPIDGLHMDDYGFTCRFYVMYTGKYVEVAKEQMIRIDPDNYMAVVDSRRLGKGSVTLRITALIPDPDFPDLLRTEVEAVPTGITIC